MSQFWQRKFELRLLDDSREGIALSSFKVNFNITWNQSSPLRKATIKIYNLGDSTINQILNQRYTRIEVYAGYMGMSSESSSQDIPVVPASRVKRAYSKPPAPVSPGYGMIFSGDLRAASTTTEANGDSLITLQVQDGFKAYKGARISTTLAAGYCAQDIYQALLEVLSKEYGIKAGRTLTFPDTRYPRGRPLEDTVAKCLDELINGKNNRGLGTHPYWQLVDGQLNIINDQMGDGVIQTLGRENGLLGQIQRTSTGMLNVTTLLNPSIRLGSLVQLAPDLPIDGDQLLIAAKGENLDNQSKPAQLDTHGIYIVRGLNYIGDTRDNDWNMTLSCQARDESDDISSGSESKNKG